MTYEVQVFVTLKEAVLDPQGSAVNHSLNQLGYTEVEDVRIGKVITLTLEGEREMVDARVTEMCEKLLANPVIEDYRFDVREVSAP
ncbi:phosphoribosylformylglycinamidine synthase subunit PurS [Alteribacter natronophilus]|uniref:phosphoribosylformylglycinamidine synthase subunit PurS n=1 Tax=Alteribacter natronophilus TaxID=2583810 RepID=UPI00110F60FC|nr:phosphoribosylformylglycinamidine synthase subunit PurS [Alteribacter natronophilus]TMW71101.1 phosphoribosylformylglycinamidine synthase subunit PurS [Alteribacter natronophilus]